MTHRDNRPAHVLSRSGWYFITAFLALIASLWLSSARAVEHGGHGVAARQHDMATAGHEGPRRHARVNARAASAKRHSAAPAAPADHVRPPAQPAPEGGPPYSDSAYPQ
jgi:hypothetical protein